MSISFTKPEHKDISVAEKKRIAQERQQTLQELEADPYIGYDSLQEAFDDCKCTPQAEALAQLFMRKNVFISGPAGSGKSYLIQRFIKQLDAEFEGRYNVAITASTGAAAQIIGGQTIHSWSGIGTNTEPFDRRRLSRSEYGAKSAIVNTDVLVIDEISMLPSYLFERLNKLLQHFRRSSEPFGGIQIVAMGDFLQLPPVPGRDENGERIETDFAVFTDAWKSANFHYSFMDKSRRAKDKRLKYALTYIANGLLTDKVRQIIESRQGGEELTTANKTYAKLFTTNRGVDAYNNQMFAKNPNRKKVLEAEFSEEGQEHHETLVKRYGINKSIELKIGAVVLLTKNRSEGLVNGSIGVVEGFTKDGAKVRFNSAPGRVVHIEKEEYTLEKKFETEDEDGNTVLASIPVASVRQVPLKLGYAISVHKSQGQTFDGVIADLSNCFTPGLGYVALSRVRDLDDLVITGFSKSAYSMDARSLKITKVVKRRALKSRKRSLENINEISAILDNSLARGVYWNDK